jgi:hypothetical protein
VVYNYYDGVGIGLAKLSLETQEKTSVVSETV